MGKASRIKRERRERRKRFGPDFADLDRDSALRLLAAASASPSCAHRQPSLARATELCWRRLRRTKHEATVESLPVLLDRGSRDGSFASLELEEPVDVRAGTRVRWGRSLFRVAPGGWERPVSIVVNALERSRIIDPVLRQDLGFGLFDLFEVGLRYSDEVLAHLEDAWPISDPDQEPDSWHLGPGSILPEELEAMRNAPLLAKTIERCSDPGSAERAARWASRSPGRLATEVGMTSGLFGPVIAVADGSSLIALPVGFILDGLYDAVDALTSLALDAGLESNALVATARQRTLHLLSGRGAPLVLDPAVGDNQILALQEVAEGLFLAVDIASPLAGTDISVVEQRLSAFSPGVTFRTEQGTRDISERDELIRLVVVHHQDSLTHFSRADGPPVSVLSAEVLRWIMTQSERPDDLVMFLRASQRREDRTFSFGPFDEWEYWSSNGGAFHRRGQPLTGMFFEPHGERAEWHWHAERGWVEEALCAVGLKQLASWPVVMEGAGGSRMTLVDRPASDAVILVQSTDRRTLTALRYDPRDEDDVSLDVVADAVASKFEFLDRRAEIAAQGTDVRIEIRRATSSATQITRDGAVIVISVGADLETDLAQDAEQVEERFGRGIAMTLPPAAQSAFTGAWRATPPGIVVDQTSIPQAATALAPLRDPHPSLISEADRAMAERLYADGVAVGRRSGTAARDLESKTIYPIVLRHLQDSFAGLARDGLLRELLADMERSLSARWHSDGAHARHAVFAAEKSAAGLSVNDLVAKVADTRSKRTTLTRLVALCIEEVVRSPPSGMATPSAFERDQIYAVARHLFEAGMRSETIHQGLSNTEIEITDGYEVTLHHAEGDLDFDRLQYMRAATSMPERPEASLPQSANDAVSVTSSLPELIGVDVALRDHGGFGLDALLGVPAVLASWPVTDTAPVAVATYEEIVARCEEELLVRVDTEELEAAARWLTLEPDGVESDLRGGAIEHWEMNRRAYRLASRPLAPTSTGAAFVAPWAAEDARTIVWGSLLDGRLPWPDRVLSEPVVAELAEYRRKRNTALERQAHEALSALPGFVAVANVKKPKVLGLSSLPREIDVVALDESRGRIWVVEVKDRTLAFSPQQIRKAVDDFNGEKGYVQRLTSNTRLIADNAASVAAALGASARDEWEVRSAMVTRRIEPAAFAGDQQVVFCTVDSIDETLGVDDTPTVQYGRSAS